MADISFAGLSEKLLTARSVLLITHERPDGDALGSTFGMCSFLRRKGIDADVFLMAPPPDRYRSIIRDYRTAEDRKRAADYDVVLSLDCANVERLAYCENVDAFAGDNFLNADHHSGNSIPAAFSLVDASASSTCEIAARIAMISTPRLDPETASFFLMGMMTDTGCFKFSNTSGNAMRTAAQLLDAGAELEKIVNTLFFSKPLNQLYLEADLVQEKLKFACSGRLVYAYIDDAMLEKYAFDLREDEGLIDILRGIDTAVVAVLVSKKGTCFKLSMRSKDRRVPVIDIARKFSGGGHAMAAGATLTVEKFSEAETT
ncbi:MAG: DHHA1 domain-containing protein, partial [Victivallaceae bacterium]|nr:DHHA1 domain-containing protein [Victivallaceae bacterium]